MATMIDLLERLMRMMNKDASETFDPATDSLEALSEAVSGRIIATGSVIGNWNSGVGTSGEAGEDLVTFPAATYDIDSLLVSINALTAGALVTVKMFMEVNGVERKVYQEVFVQGTDPDGLWIVNGPVSVHEAIRVEVHSSVAADDGRAVAYDYMGR